LPAGNAVWGERRNPDFMPHGSAILTHFSRRSMEARRVGMDIRLADRGEMAASPGAGRARHDRAAA
jgi:hypothetical protein